MNLQSSFILQLTSFVKPGSGFWVLDHRSSNQVLVFGSGVQDVKNVRSRCRISLKHYKRIINKKLMIWEDSLRIRTAMQNVSQIFVTCSQNNWKMSRKHPPMLRNSSTFVRRSLNLGPSCAAWVLARAGVCLSARRQQQQS